MARIEGVDLPRDKRVEVGLTYLFGVGRSRAQQVLTATGIPPSVRIRDLTEDQVTAIRDYVGQSYTVEGDLRREEQMNIKRLIEIGCYRGLRHRRALPVRGQRTRTNSRTRKGPKKTVAGRGRRRGAKKKDTIVTQEPTTEPVVNTSMTVAGRMRPGTAAIVKRKKTR